MSFQITCHVVANCPTFYWGVLYEKNRSDSGRSRGFVMGEREKFRGHNFVVFV